MVTPRSPSRRSWGTHFLVLMLALLLGGCASMEASTKQRQVASMLALLFPGSNQPLAAMSTDVAVIKVPFRTGVAFVSDNGSPAFRLPETESLRLAGLVRDAFAKTPSCRASRPCARSTWKAAAASKTSTVSPRCCGWT